MLDTFAYPVSALMKLLHDLLSLWIAPDTGTAWVASIVLLVCTVRLILLRPGWRQLWSARRTALLQPQLAALRRKHGENQQAYLQAVRDLHHSEGVGIASAIVPVLVQLPVFLGLYHVLAAFTVVGANGTNGLFGPEQVQSFAHATIFGVPLSAAIRTPALTLAGLHPGLTTINVIWVVAPLLVVAALATFVNGWRAHRRQPAAVAAEDNPLAASFGQLSKLMVWLSPVGLLLCGVTFPLPLAVAVYWAVNGTWSTVQTQLMTARLDRLLPLPDS